MSGFCPRNQDRKLTWQLATRLLVPAWMLRIKNSNVTSAKYDYSIRKENRFNDKNVVICKCFQFLVESLDMVECFQMELIANASIVSTYPNMFSLKENASLCFSNFWVIDITTANVFRHGHWFWSFCLKILHIWDLARDYKGDVWPVLRSCQVTSLS